MSVGVEALFTSALGLQPPWVVQDVKLDTAKRRIDFQIDCQGARLACPACGASAEPVHDRLARSWRHLDFFQFEAWLHCDVPRVACGACGKTTQVAVPWARPGSGFTAAFEALALTLCRDLPVRQAALLLRCADKQLWRRIEFYVQQARALEVFADVQIVGVDETSLRRGQDYITVVRDLDAKRLLFVTERPQAQISYDGFHVVSMAIEAMDQVRRQEMAQDAQAVRLALGADDCRRLRQLLWGMRRNPQDWSRRQIDTMHWLQRSALKSARAWRLKMALREVHAAARANNSVDQAAADLRAWLSWARRCRLEPFKKLATTLKERFEVVVRGMVDHRSNAFVEAINGLLQQAKRAARGFRTSANFIAIAYLRMSKLKHLPVSTFATAAVK